VIAAPGSGGARRGRKLRKGSSGPGYDGSVRRLFGWTAGLVGIAALARLLVARRDRTAAPALPSAPPPAEDPAEELRRKLAESRDADARPASPTATPEPVGSLDERRARVHAKAQEAIEAMDDLEEPA
jgi:hypothetical protein